MPFLSSKWWWIFKKLTDTVTTSDELKDVSLSTAFQLNSMHDIYVNYNAFAVAVFFLRILHFIRCFVPFHFNRNCHEWSQFRTIRKVTSHTISHIQWISPQSLNVIIVWYVYTTVYSGGSVCLTHIVFTSGICSVQWLYRLVFLCLIGVQLNSAVLLLFLIVLFSISAFRRDAIWFILFAHSVPLPIYLSQLILNVYFSFFASICLCRF